jgi:hypothetical protein
MQEVQTITHYQGNLDLYENELLVGYEKLVKYGGNATVLELRTGIFAPLNKIPLNSAMGKSFIANKRTRTIETSWGKAIVKGNILTQVHRDILDCILVHAHDIRMANDGSVSCAFSPYEIAKHYYSKDSNVKINSKWLEKQITELQTSAIELRAKDSDEDFISFNIVSLFAKSTKVFSKKNTPLYMVRISKEYVHFFANQLALNYRGVLNDLLTINSSLIKSIVRFMISHQNITISLDELLKSIGYDINDLSKQSKWKVKMEVKESANILTGFGISMDEKTMNLKYHSDSKSDCCRIKYLPALYQKPKGNVA